MPAAAICRPQMRALLLLLSLIAALPATASLEERVKAALGVLRQG